MTIENRDTRLQNRFVVVTLENFEGYKVFDTQPDKFCSYSGKAFNPPRYEGESLCKYSVWGNWHAAFGFAQRLEYVN